MLTARGIVVLAIVAGAVAVSQSFGRFTYSVLLTDIRDDLGISNTLAGTLGSANLAAYLLGSLFVTVVIGRVGVAVVAQVGLASVTAGLVLLAWAPNGFVVAAGLVVTGFTAAGVWVTAPALATAQLGPDRRASAIGVSSMGVGGGMVLASWLDTAVEWRSVYSVEVAVGLVVLVASLALVRVPKTAAIVVPQVSSGPSLPVRATNAIKSVPGWKPLLGAYGLYGSCMALVITFLVALLEDDAGYSPARATGAFLALAIGSMCGGPIYGYLTDRAGRRFGLVSSFSLLGVMALVITTGHRPGATIAAFVFGLAFTGGPVSVGARIADFAEGTAFGAAYGIATLAFGVGLTTGPQVGGALADLTDSFRPAFFIAAVTAVAGAAFAWAAVPARNPNHL